MLEKLNRFNNLKNYRFWNAFWKTYLSVKLFRLLSISSRIVQNIIKMFQNSGDVQVTRLKKKNQYWMVMIRRQSIKNQCEEHFHKCSELHHLKRTEEKRRHLARYQRLVQRPASLMVCGCFSTYGICSCSTHSMYAT